MKSIRKEISRTKAYDRFIVGNLTCGTKRHREEKFRASRNWTRDLKEIMNPPTPHNPIVELSY